MAPSKLPVVVIVGFFILFLIPLIVLLLTPVAQLAVTFKPNIVFNQETFDILLTTVEIAAGGMLLNTPIIFTYAWLVNRTDLPGKRFFDSVVIYGKTMPEFVKAIGWVILLNPANGMLNQLLQPIFHHPIFDVYTPLAISWAWGFGGIPQTYLTCSGPVKNLDSSKEEASRVSGHSLLRTFLSVSIPSLRQIISIMLVSGFLAAFENFDYPIVLAPPGGFETLSTYVDHFASDLVPPDYGSAASIGIIFLLLSLVLFGVYLIVTRRTTRFQSITGTASQRTVHSLRGVGRWAAFSFCSLVIFASFGLPLISLLWLSLTVPGRLFTFVGLKNFIDAISIPQYGIAFQSSALLGLVTVAVAVPIGTIAAYGIFRARFRFSRIFEYIVILPKGVPGIVYGLAVFLMFILVPGLNTLYGTIVPFVIATSVIAVPDMILIISGNMVQIGDELEDASRVGGARWTHTFVRVVTPLSRHAIFNAITVTFLDSIRSLAPVILLVTPSFFLYLPLLLNQYDGQIVSLNVLAASSLLITLFLVSFIGVVKLVERLTGGAPGL